MPKRSVHVRYHTPITRQDMLQRIVAGRSYTWETCAPATETMCKRKLNTRGRTSITAHRCKQLDSVANAPQGSACDKVWDGDGLGHVKPALIDHELKLEQRHHL